MKTVFLTASIVSNLFLCALLYSFASGKIERNPDTRVAIEQDTIGAMYDTARPVTLARK